MLDWIKIYLMAAVVFVILDAAWIFLVANKLYQEELGHLMGTVKIVPAAVFYLIYLAAILFFAVHPALEKQSLSYAILAGGFLGLACYATYDLTNWSTLKDWPATVSVLDLIWGTSVSAITAGATYWFTQFFNWR